MATTVREDTGHGKYHHCKINGRSVLAVAVVVIGKRISVHGKMPQL